jgi:hypothetical protein
MDSYVSNQVDNNEEECFQKLFPRMECMETSEILNAHSQEVVEANKDLIGDRIIRFAPGEGTRPLGIFTDKNLQTLALLFPNFFFSHH